MQVEITSASLVIDHVPIDNVSHMMYAKIRIEYKGGIDGIASGDTLTYAIHNDANAVLEVVGYGNHTLEIYGDGDIGIVGIRTYRNDADGNYYLDVEFDDGYNSYFEGDMPSTITGWLETSVQIEYKQRVQEETTTTILQILNGEEGSTGEIIVNPGGPYDGVLPGIAWPLSKDAFYGSTQGVPIVSDNDYSQFDLMRWTMTVGFDIITFRDLRCSDGETAYTTTETLACSHTNPTGPNYQSVNESYLVPYTTSSYYGRDIDTPFHYANTSVDDYAFSGSFSSYSTPGTQITSAHSYLQDSVRIIRIVARQPVVPEWGYDYVIPMVDQNFLIEAPVEPVDRNPEQYVYFKDHRGLTLDEFLTQLHSEGQLLDILTVDDLITFDEVPVSESPFATSGQTHNISHFHLKLGNLFFDPEYSGTVNIISRNMDLVFEDIPAANLVYGYIIYYDTYATEAVLFEDGFLYRNAAKFNHNADYPDYSYAHQGVVVKLEDQSGGGGTHKSINVRKVNEEKEPVQGVTFVLTQLDVFPPVVRTAKTTLNGNLSFTLRVGEYTLEEMPLVGYLPIAPLSFTVSGTDTHVNLIEKMMDTGYIDMARLSYTDAINFIENQLEPEPPTATFNIVKVDEEGYALEGVVFTLTKLDATPAEVHTQTTSSTGLVSFSITHGMYLLEEEAQTGYIGITPITFHFDSGVSTIDLVTLLAGTGYPQIENISYLDGYNFIVNRVYPDPQLKIKKISETGAPLSGVTFVLTQTDETPPIVKEGQTDANGALTFILPIGSFDLIEVPTQGYSPLPPMNFSVVEGDDIIDLVQKLAGTAYPHLGDISFIIDTNVIINKLVPDPDKKDKCQVKIELLVSIAYNEIALSHILNAEGEKLQFILNHQPTIAQVLEANASVNAMLNTVNALEFDLIRSMEMALKGDCS